MIRVRRQSDDITDPGGEWVADPATGKAWEIGSDGWAKRWRLETQASVGRMDREPIQTAGMLKQGIEHRVWTLLNRRDGSRFSTFEEFCGAKQPWGLGRPFEDIRRILTACVGDRGFELIAVAPDRRALNGANQHTGPRVDSAPERTNPRTKTAALRAIAERAPEPVRELYRVGLLGQKEAARLGPKSPTPDQAARVTAAAQALASEAEKLASFPKPEAQKRLNEKARELLGKPKPTKLERTQHLYLALDAVGRKRFRIWVRENP